MNVKVNIVYGEEDFKELFKKYVDIKNEGIIYKIKNDYKIRYNYIDYLSTKEIVTEVEVDE